MYQWVVTLVLWGPSMNSRSILTSNEMPAQIIWKLRCRLLILCSIVKITKGLRYTISLQSFLWWKILELSENGKGFHCPKVQVMHEKKLPFNWARINWGMFADWWYIEPHSSRNCVPFHSLTAASRRPEGRNSWKSQTGEISVAQRTWHDEVDLFTFLVS